MSELTKHFDKFNESKEQLTERILNESPTKSKNILNESSVPDKSTLKIIEQILKQLENLEHPFSKVNDRSLSDAWNEAIDALDTLKQAVKDYVV